MPGRNPGFERFMHAIGRDVEAVMNAFPSSTLDHSIQRLVIDAYIGDETSAKELQDKLYPDSTLRTHHAVGGEYIGIAIRDDEFFCYSKVPSRARLLAILNEYREDMELNAIADERKEGPHREFPIFPGEAR